MPCVVFWLLPFRCLLEGSKIFSCIHTTDSPNLRREPSSRIVVGNFNYLYNLDTEYKILPEDLAGNKKTDAEINMKDGKLVVLTKKDIKLQELNNQIWWRIWMHDDKATPIYVTISRFLYDRLIRPVRHYFYDNDINWRRFVESFFSCEILKVWNRTYLPSFSHVVDVKDFKRASIVQATVRKSTTLLTNRMEFNFKTSIGSTNKTRSSVNSGSIISDYRTSKLGIPNQLSVPGFSRSHGSQVSLDSKASNSSRKTNEIRRGSILRDFFQFGKFLGFLTG